MFTYISVVTVLVLLLKKGLLTLCSGQRQLFLWTLEFDLAP